MNDVVVFERKFSPADYLQKPIHNGTGYLGHGNRKLDVIDFVALLCFAVCMAKEIVPPTVGSVERALSLPGTR